jgi:hypothetical protein
MTKLADDPLIRADHDDLLKIKNQHHFSAESNRPYYINSFQWIKKDRVFIISVLKIIRRVCF